MKPGSVIVDLSAESGGNCELTEKDEIVTKNGVFIIGKTDLASMMAGAASSLYSKSFENIKYLYNFQIPLDHMITENIMIYNLF
jgi:NAD(P) transhydrogenase subunit alpha